MDSLKVLLTGAFGIVGRDVLDCLLERNYKIRILEIKNNKNRARARNYEGKVELLWGDIRDLEKVIDAIKGVDFIIHLAAIIPPLADEKPELAYEVNVEGTKNVIKAINRIKGQPKPKLIYSSSISIYGDRRDYPYIKRDDPPNPNPTDYYAQQKIKAERLIRQSNLVWSIFRLTYIVSPDKLDLDPLMFEMPLDTRLEICHAKDVALALANAIETPQIWGRMLHIAGGSNCRTTYKKYLKRMFNIFGLGFEDFPEKAFSRGNFHCGYMETDLSQRLLQYQHHSIEDYYKEVEKKIGLRYYFYRTFKGIAKYLLLKKSEYY